MFESIDKREHNVRYLCYHCEKKNNKKQICIGVVNGQKYNNLLVTYLKKTVES